MSPIHERSKQPDLMSSKEQVARNVEISAKTVVNDVKSDESITIHNEVLV